MRHGNELEAEIVSPCPEFRILPRLVQQLIGSKSQVLKFLPAGNQMKMMRASLYAAAVIAFGVPSLARMRR